MLKAIMNRINVTQIISLGLFILFQCTQSIPTYLEPLSQEMIDYVNSHPQSTWTAAPSKHFQSLADAQTRLGVKRPPPKWNLRTGPKKFYSGRLDLPDAFDARQHWPNCTTIGRIRDQSGCGSCWAFGAVEAMSDRICIHSNGQINVELSARDLISCCPICGNGCQGGYVQAAWDYWVKYGIVTGGSMEQPSGCQPYPFPSCDHHPNRIRPKCTEYYDTPRCLKTCQPQYNYTFEQDKFYGHSYYDIDENEHAIMEEIMFNGPVQASFDVYEDFFNYEAGIYSHLAGRWAGKHAIKIVGWGIDKGTKYWLLANSWNEDWGEKGFFRIKRGINECGIESEPIAGIPLI